MKYILFFLWCIALTVSWLIFGLLVFVGYTVWHLKFPPKDAFEHWWENLLNFKGGKIY